MSRSQERLRKILEERGQDPKKSLGQNFLINDGTIEKIIQATADFKPRHLIEVGPGPGSLTYSLRENRALTLETFCLIELDRGWAEFWRNQNMVVIEADALQISWFELIQDQTVLVSNLPYQISSSLVIDRSLDIKPLSGMVLMFQKEVAQKIRSRPKDELYGFLSVIAQNFWRISAVAEAGPRDFWPPPKVASRVLRFAPLSPEEKPQDPSAFLEFVKTAFRQRRKTLRSNWEPYLNRKPGGWDRILAEILAMDFTDKLRAEELSPQQFSCLFRLWKSF